jgi:hypothetical protein
LQCPILQISNKIVRFVKTGSKPRAGNTTIQLTRRWKLKRGTKVYNQLSAMISCAAICVLWMNLLSSQN